jgi:hypothetical protein
MSTASTASWIVGWTDCHEHAVRVGTPQHVADLADVARDDQGDAVALQVLGQLTQHPGAGDVDEGHRLGVEHDRMRVGRDAGVDRRADVLGVGEEQAALDAQDDDPWRRLVPGWRSTST